MLKKITKEERDKYIDFAYALAMDFTKCSYPVFYDGIKTKDDFIRGTNFAFENSNEEILIFSQDDKIKGWLQYYFTEENQINIYTFLCDCNYEQMVDEFIYYISEKYSNPSIGIGIPYENNKVRERLLYHGFKLEEKSYNCVLKIDDYEVLDEVVCIQKLEKENFNDFKQLHDKIVNDIYWNSERILEDFDNWLIYVYRKNEEVIGTLYCMKEFKLLEIFGVDYKENVFNQDVLNALLLTFLNDCKKNKSKDIIYFVENLEIVKYIEELGFKLIGEYNYFLLKKV